MSSNLVTSIKQHLANKQMSAAELERRTGIPHAVVNILHGRSKNPSLRTVQAIARELGCSLESLLGETEAISKPQSKSTKWQAKLYLEASQAVIARLNTGIEPDLQILANCINEAYNYSIASPEQKIDLRFVDWLVAKYF